MICVSSACGGFISRSVSIFSSAALNFALWYFLSGIVVVQRSPFCWRFMWPLSVSGDDYGRLFCTDAYVIPGHVANCLFSIAFTNVLFVGLNIHWCTYLMMYSLLVMVYALAVI